MSVDPKSPESLFQALSDRTRVRLLRLLSREELNVRELVSVLGLSQPTVSRHLAVLREAGWLEHRREGTWSWYRTVQPAQFTGGEGLFEEVLATADHTDCAAGDDEALSAVMARRHEKARDFFADIAESWDTIREGYEHNDIRLGTLGALVDRRLEVLDVGTGTGALLPLLAGTVDRVVAVDNSEAMLDRARRRCRQDGLQGVEFRLADVEELPFPDGSFSAAFCSMLLHHVARPAAAVAEMARVIEPGGKLIVIAFTKHHLTWMRDELAHQRLGFSRDEIEEMMRAAGVVPRSFLVRSGKPATGPAVDIPVGPNGDDWTWPDVFLAVAERPPAINQ